LDLYCSTFSFITRYKSFVGFDSLPPEMKVHLFTFLSPTERGSAALVSRQWRDHMYDPTVWTVVDLTTFPQILRRSAPQSPAVVLDKLGSVASAGEESYGGVAPVGEKAYGGVARAGEELYGGVARVGEESYRGVASPTCEESYGSYRACMHSFLSHLSVIVRPTIRVLRIMLDIGDVKDGWNEAITELLNKSRLHQLHTVLLIWNR